MVTEASLLRSAGTSLSAKAGVGVAPESFGFSIEEMFENLPVALIVVSFSGTIVSGSAIAAQALCTDQPLAGRALDEVLAPLTTLLDARRSDSSVSVQGPNGERRYGYSISEISPTTGSVSHYAIVFRDITQAAHVASERDRLVHLAAVGASAPAVIHEVKNSLAAITMGLGLLGEEAQDAELGKQAAALAAEAESVAYRLDAFGAVARPARSRRAVDLERTLTEARRSVDARAVRGNVLVHWDVEELPPLYLDPGLVHAFVLELGTNAIQASTPGGGVSIDVQLDDDTFVLSIEDEGIGMTPEVLAQSTQLFFSNRGRSGGTGLTLVDQAVRAGGGELNIQSAPNQGTRVTLRMPRATEFER